MNTNTQERKICTGRPIGVAALRKRISQIDASAPYNRRTRLDSIPKDIDRSSATHDEKVGLLLDFIQITGRIGTISRSLRSEAFNLLVKVATPEHFLKIQNFPLTSADASADTRNDLEFCRYQTLIKIDEAQYLRLVASDHGAQIKNHYLIGLALSCGKSPEAFYAGVTIISDRSSDNYASVAAWQALFNSPCQQLPRTMRLAYLIDQKAVLPLKEFRDMVGYAMLLVNDWLPELAGDAGRDTRETIQLSLLELDLPTLGFSTLAAIDNGRIAPRIQEFLVNTKERLNAAHPQELLNFHLAAACLCSEHLAEYGPHYDHNSPGLLPTDVPVILDSLVKLARAAHTGELSGLPGVSAFLTEHDISADRLFGFLLTRALNPRNVSWFKFKGGNVDATQKLNAAGVYDDKPLIAEMVSVLHQEGSRYPGIIDYLDRAFEATINHHEAGVYGQLKDPFSYAPDHRNALKLTDHRTAPFKVLVETGNISFAGSRVDTRNHRQSERMGSFQDYLPLLEIAQFKEFFPRAFSALSTKKPHRP